MVDLSWARTLPWHTSKPRYGALLSIDNDGAAFWLPSTAFVKIGVTPGNHRLTVRWWPIDSSGTAPSPPVTFSCQPGSAANLLVSARWTNSNAVTELKEIGALENQDSSTRRTELLLPAWFGDRYR